MKQHHKSHYELTYKEYQLSQNGVILFQNNGGVQ